MAKSTKKATAAAPAKKAPRPKPAPKPERIAGAVWTCPSCSTSHELKIDDVFPFKG